MLVLTWCASSVPAQAACTFQPTALLPTAQEPKACVMPGAVVRRLLRMVPLWRRAWGNTLILARRGGDPRRAAYKLLPL